MVAIVASVRDAVIVAVIVAVLGSIWVMNVMVMILVSLPLIVFASVSIGIWVNFTFGHVA